MKLRYRCLMHTQSQFATGRGLTLDAHRGKMWLILLELICKCLHLSHLSLCFFINVALRCQFFICMTKPNFHEHTEYRTDTRLICLLAFLSAVIRRLLSVQSSSCRLLVEWRLWALRASCSSSSRLFCCKCSSSDACSSALCSSWLRLPWACLSSAHTYIVTTPVKHCTHGHGHKTTENSTAHCDIVLFRVTACFTFSVIRFTHGS